MFRPYNFIFRQDSNWGGAFAEWGEKIKENIGPKNHFNLVPKFSTTGILQ